MNKIVKYFKKNWLKCLILLGVGVILAVIYLAASNGWSKLYNYISAFEIGGAVVILLGLLSLVADQGTFDIFSYLFKRKKFDNGVHENYSQYAERRKEQIEAKDKFGWICYLVVGAFLFLVVLILFLVNNSIR